jgi:MFS superfamily sulfate permease-like transporter
LPGLVVYRFGAPLYFANASLFRDDVERLITAPPTPVRWFVLDAEAMVDIDTAAPIGVAKGLGETADGTAQPNVVDDQPRQGEAHPPNRGFRPGHSVGRGRNM